MIRISETRTEKEKMTRFVKNNDENTQEIAEGMLNMVLEDETSSI